MDEINELGKEAERVLALFRQMENVFNKGEDKQLSDAYLKIAIMAGLKGAYNKGLMFQENFHAAGGI